MEAMQVTLPSLSHAHDLNPSQSRAVIDFLREQLIDLFAIYAFGSRVQGVANASSDLDLAVLVPTYVPSLRLWDLSHLLATRLGHDVDLLDLRAASTVMQHQVLSTGIKLWSQEPQAGLFECFVFSEKFDLDIARAGYLSDIVERGSVYGR